MTRTEKTSWIGRIVKFMLWLLLLGFLLVALMVWGMPRIALWAASAWYAQQGDGYQLSVSDWTYRPWHGEVSLHGVTLKHPNKTSASSGLVYQQTQLQRVELALDMDALQARQWVIRYLVVDGMKVALHQRADILHIAGLIFPSPSDAKEASPVSTTTSIAVDDQGLFPLRIDAIDIRAIDVHWQLDSISAEPLDAEPVVMAMSGNVVLDHLRIGSIDTVALTTVPLSLHITLPHLQATQPLAFSLEQSLVWQFDGEWQGGLVSPLLEGRSVLQAFDLTLDGAPPLSFSRLALDGVRLSYTEQSITELALSDLRIGTEQQPLLALAHYHLDDIRRSEQSITTGLHGFAGLQVHIERLENGHWAGLTAIEPTSGVAAAPTNAMDVAPVVDADLGTSGRESDTLLDSSMGSSDALAAVELRMAGVSQLSSDGHILFRDLSVRPHIEKNVRLQQVQIETLRLTTDSWQLTQPLRWHVQLTLDEFSRIESDGSLSALDTDADAEMTLVVRQLDLVPFNAYLTQMTGYQLQRGLLDVDLDVAIHNGMLSGEIRLRLRNSRFEAVNEQVIRRLSQQIAMPVETALSLLRDDDNVVRLTIPLSGSLQDPNLGLGDLTRQLSRLAVQSAAGFYLRQSLQPYGALVSLASYAGSELLAIRLQAIEFESLSNELDTDAQAYLTKVADIMHGKTNLQLRVCPFVSRDEMALITELADAAPLTWQQLAQQRGAAVRGYLAPLQDQAGNPLFERISLCVAQQGRRGEVVLGF